MQLGARDKQVLRQIGDGGRGLDDGVHVLAAEPVDASIVV